MKGDAALLVIILMMIDISVTLHIHVKLYIYSNEHCLAGPSLLRHPPSLSSSTPLPSALVIYCFVVVRSLSTPFVAVSLSTPLPCYIYLSLCGCAVSLSTPLPCYIYLSLCGCAIFVWL